MSKRIGGVSWLLNFVRRHQAVVVIAAIAVVAIVVAGVAWCATADAKDALERPKFVLTAIGTYGAFVAFIVGLMQYRTAQQWKRAEFVAAESTKILQDPRTEVALKMVDWAVRTLKLKALDGKQGDEGTVVTMAMQAWALTPHNLIRHPSPEMEQRAAEKRGLSSAQLERIESDPATSDSSTDGSMEGQDMRVYSSEETIIRDCYDRLLDGLDRMGSYLESGLLRPAELQPYFKYWVEDIAAPAADDLSALWNVCLLTFMLVYGHEGTVVLFAYYGHDVTPAGDVFEGFLRKLRKKDVDADVVLTDSQRDSILKRRAGYLERALELRRAALEALRASPLLARRVEQVCTHRKRTH